MSFTYNIALTTDNDKVRFEIQDTDIKKQLVQDEEITYALTQEGTVLKACARICEALAVKFARDEEVRTSGTTIIKSTVTDKYIKMARRFRQRSAKSTGFLIPALSVADKAVNEQDTDIPQPFASRGVHDNTRTGQLQKNSLT